MGVGIGTVEKKQLSAERTRAGGESSPSGCLQQKKGEVLTPGTYERLEQATALSADKPPCKRSSRAALQEETPKSRSKSSPKGKSGTQKQGSVRKKSRIASKPRRRSEVQRQGFPSTGVTPLHAAEGDFLAWFQVYDQLPEIWF